jgi:hypothetical protein
VTAVTREERIAVIRADLDRSRSDLARTVADRAATRHLLADRPPIGQAGDYQLEYRTTTTETESNFVPSVQNSEPTADHWSGWEQ